jgi:hypothetical protein
MKIQDARNEENRLEALKRREESTKRKQAAEEVEPIYQPEFQAQKVLRELLNIQAEARKASKM